MPRLPFLLPDTIPVLPLEETGIWDNGLCIQIPPISLGIVIPLEPYTGIIDVRDLIEWPPEFLPEIPKEFSPTAASVAIIATIEDIPHMLCIQRASPPAQGYWSIPGGRIEYSEDPYFDQETPQEAAEREVREETLFQLSAEEVQNSWKFGFKYLDSGHRLVIFLLEISTGDERINLISETSDEVIQVRWVPIDELRINDEYANKTEHLTALLMHRRVP